MLVTGNVSKNSFNTVEERGGINWVEEYVGGEEEKVHGILENWV